MKSFYLKQKRPREIFCVFCILNVRGTGCWGLFCCEADVTGYGSLSVNLGLPSLSPSDWYEV